MRRRWQRWVLPVVAGAFAVRVAIRDGVGAIAPVAFVTLWLLAAWVVATRTRRPMRSLYAVGLGSVMVAALFVGIPAASGSPVLFGIIGWAGVSVLALIWVVHLEWIEPRAN